MSLDTLTPDKYQQQIINLSLERTAIVKGVAGSGKSFLLLKKAKQASTKENSSFAIIVYTKSLKQFFVDELKEIDASGKNVYYYAQWMKLEEKPDVDYLFVDETQDFGPIDIDDFRSHGKYCWFFGDSDQSIMAFPDHPVQPIEETERQLGIQAYVLRSHHRLTIENAKVGEYILPQTQLSNACTKHGSNPKLIQTDNQLDKIIEYVESGMTDIGILVYFNYQVTDIRNYFKSKSIPVEWKSHDYMYLDFKSTNPKIITWHCSKGVQFNNVFLPYCGVDETRNVLNIKQNPAKECRQYGDLRPMIIYPNALYVATTRPLENLYIIYTDNLTPRLPQEQSSIYDNNVTSNIKADLPF